ncbi:unnamed protein product [Rotaria sordida]|uniref:LIM zinc-binding domain-containing protein n=1 Tax=Rotaria sordida TaxID=392033 RepID=A0A814FB70_9BILA|nr:unnamed protein product [Rotaria sordida]
MDVECSTKLTHLFSCNKSIYKDGIAYFICSACQIVIEDKFYLCVRSKIYHESCLQCAICQIPLNEQSKCFLKGVDILCSKDYYKYFINKCSKCDRFIYPNDWIRRACENIYHLTCFACYTCGRQLSTDEEYALDNGHILCKIHVMGVNENNYYGKCFLFLFKNYLNFGTFYNVANKQSETKRVRTAFTIEQLHMLRANFQIDSNPDGQNLEWIAQTAGMNE